MRNSENPAEVGTVNKGKEKQEEMRPVREKSEERVDNVGSYKLLKVWRVMSREKTWTDCDVQDCSGGPAGNRQVWQGQKLLSKSR